MLISSKTTLCQGCFQTFGGQCKCKHISTNRVRFYAIRRLLKRVIKHVWTNCSFNITILFFVLSARWLWPRCLNLQIQQKTWISTRNDQCIKSSCSFVIHQRTNVYIYTLSDKKWPIIILNHFKWMHRLLLCICHYLIVNSKQLQLICLNLLYYKNTFTFCIHVTNKNYIWHSGHLKSVPTKMHQRSTTSYRCDFI